MNLYHYLFLNHAFVRLMKYQYKETNKSIDQL